MSSGIARKLAIGAMAIATFGALQVRADAKLLAQPPREVEFRLGLEAPQTLRIDLMRNIRDVSLDRIGPVRLYTHGPWGRWTKQARVSLSWKLEGASAEEDPSLAAALAPRIATSEPLAPLEPPPPLQVVKDRAWMSRYDFGMLPSFDTTGFGLSTDGFDSVFRLPPMKPVIDWRCRRKPTLVMRAGGESESFDLVKCDGSIAPDALDRLSILARPPEAPRPGDLLPDEPEERAWSAKREWIDGVRLVHPRLLWALQQLSDAFPRKAILLHSGYRPRAEVNDGSGHRSLHADGRALDIAIYRVPNEELFKACTKLRGIGCGFYPNNKFVHIDVRRAEAGEAFFIDASQPGEPAKYVDEYPGLVQDGKLLAPPKKEKGSQP